MNKIIDFKVNSKFNSDGPKFSLCLESNGLSCQIPNIYKTFCHNFIDPSKNTALNLDINYIKYYLIGTLQNTDPFDVIINNYQSIISSNFKTKFDPCEKILVNNSTNKILEKFSLTDEGFKIIIETIKFMKDVCLLTGYDTKNIQDLNFDLILDPRIIKLEKPSDICLLDPDIKKKLRLCCMVYIISNSKDILKSNSKLLNLSFYENILQCSKLLENILDTLSTVLEATKYTKIKEKLNMYRGYPILVSLFFKCTTWYIEISNILSPFDDNIYLGESINRSDSDAFSTGFYVPLNIFGMPLKWFTTCPKEFLATAICHEIGHSIKDLDILPINKYKKIVNDVSSKWKLNYSQLSFDHMYNELFCDLIGVEWLENYLFDTHQNSNLSDDQKYNIIKNSFAWNCNYPKSSIVQGHPHHSFRVNLLLVSTKIHNFLCSYDDKKLIKFDKNSNPACLDDADYLNHSEYYSKYLKYKNKYLALKTNQQIK